MLHDYDGSNGSDERAIDGIVQEVGQQALSTRNPAPSQTHTRIPKAALPWSRKLQSDSLQPLEGLASSDSLTRLVVFWMPASPTPEGRHVLPAYERPLQLKTLQPLLWCLHSLF